jgi:serine/threonine-protein kinase RsbW
MLSDSPHESTEPNGATMSPADLQVRHEQVLLVVPAKPVMWVLIRMAASALASSLDFSYDAIEDLRLAVTELCSSCAANALDDATCVCRFELGPDYVELHCTISPVRDAPDPSDEVRAISTLGLSRQLIQATADEFAIREVEGDSRSAYLRKQRYLSPRG